MRLVQAAAQSLRVLGVLLVLVATFGIAVGVGMTATGVFASHDDPDVIHACVNPISFVARIVDNPARCARYEELVEWQGSAGAADVEARLSALETRQAELACITSEAVGSQAVNDVVFEGCNVHVRSGSGQTDGAVNGLGNLIVGYNESNGDTRTGSHNLVVGQRHSYSSYGGLVVGLDNTLGNSYASVSGGFGNTASGEASSVSGGLNNTASGFSSSVSGGNSNAAGGNYASVAGGIQGTAAGEFDTLIGDSDGVPTFDATTDSLIFDDEFIP